MAKVLENILTFTIHYDNIVIKKQRYYTKGDYDMCEINMYLLKEYLKKCDNDTLKDIEALIREVRAEEKERIRKEKALEKAKKYNFRVLTEAELREIEEYHFNTAKYMEFFFTESDYRHEYG